MTKEEAIKDIIDIVKNGVNNPLDVYCDSYPCSTCPFHNDENGECAETMISGLIERLLKAEEHQETNLDHYIIRGIGVCITMEDDCEKWGFRFKKGAEKQFFDENNKPVLDWLLSPYEEPKPKYNLTQFEQDLLECYDVGRRISEFWLLDKMHKKGYFKGIPTDVPINKILANCEVVEE